jgi:hypothetical protein
VPQGSRLGTGLAEDHSAQAAEPWAVAKQDSGKRVAGAQQVEGRHASHPYQERLQHLDQAQPGLRVVVVAAAGPAGGKRKIRQQTVKERSRIRQTWNKFWGAAG